MTEASRRSLWLLKEGRRSLLATGASVVVGVAVAQLYPVPTRHEMLVRSVIQVCSIWALLSLFHALLFYLAFRGVRGPALEEAVDIAFPPGTPRGMDRFFGVSGPWWSVSLATLALVGIIPVIVDPRLRAHPPLLAAAAALVAASWVDVVVTCAMHYARLDRRGDMLQFPDDDPRSLTDYLYVSVCSQATFGTTDVQLVHPVMRKTVMGHGLLAFFFNTVIVAVLVSVVVSTSE